MPVLSGPFIDSVAPSTQVQDVSADPIFKSIALQVWALSPSIKPGILRSQRPLASDAAVFWGVLRRRQVEGSIFPIADGSCSKRSWSTRLSRYGVEAGAVLKVLLDRRSARLYERTE